MPVGNIPHLQFVKMLCAGNGYPVVGVVNSFFWVDHRPLRILIFPVKIRVVGVIGICPNLRIGIRVGNFLGKHLRACAVRVGDGFRRFASLVVNNLIGPPFFIVADGVNALLDGLLSRLRVDLWLGQPIVVVLILTPGLLTICLRCLIVGPLLGFPCVAHALFFSGNVVAIQVSGVLFCPADILVIVVRIFRIEKLGLLWRRQALRGLAIRRDRRRWLTCKI